MRDTGGKALDHLPVFSYVTPCQFDFDFRHHVFRYENAPRQQILGASFFASWRKVSDLFLTTQALAGWRCWPRGFPSSL